MDVRLVVAVTDGDWVSDHLRALPHLAEDSFAAGRAQPLCKRGRELGVDVKIHSAAVMMGSSISRAA